MLDAINQLMDLTALLNIYKLEYLH